MVEEFQNFIAFQTEIISNRAITSRITNRNKMMRVSD